MLTLDGNVSIIIHATEDRVIDTVLAAIEDRQDDIAEAAVANDMDLLMEVLESVTEDADTHLKDGDEFKLVVVVLTVTEE